MNKSDAAAVKTAKRGGRRKKSSSESSTEASGVVTDTIQQAREKVKNSVKSQIIAGGISDALSDIANGDFGDAGDMAIASLQSFIGGVEHETLTLEAAEVPQKLLPSLGD